MTFSLKTRVRQYVEQLSSVVAEDGYVPWSMEKEDRNGPQPTCIPLLPPAEHSHPHSLAAGMDLWFCRFEQTRVRLAREPRASRAL
jgi:hypothetical protein